MNQLATDSGLKRRQSSDLGRQPVRDRDSKRVSRLFSKERARAAEPPAKTQLSKVLAKLVPQSATNKSQPKEALLRALRQSLQRKPRRQLPGGGDRGSQESSAQNKRRLSRLFRKDLLLKTCDPRPPHSLRRQRSWSCSPAHHASALPR